MRPYQSLLQNILQNGIDERNERTGEVCRTIIAPSITLSCDEGFHAVTTKKLAFKSVVAEILGFFRGYTSAAQFRELGTKIWDDNANKTPAWVNSVYRNGPDHTGEIYGAQWVDWKAYRIPENEAQNDALLNDPTWQRLGWKDNEDGSPGNPIYTKSINQLKNLVKKLLTDPSDRRMIVSAWNIGEFDRMSLPPCHVDYRFVSLKPEGAQRRQLHVVMTMRSTDVFLGLPFNIASTEVFLHIIARLTDHDPASVTIQMTNAHLYESHLEKAYKQIHFEPMKLPKLVLSDNIKPVALNAQGEVDFEFSSIEPSDIWLEGYSFHEWDSRAPMAV